MRGVISKKILSQEQEHSKKYHYTIIRPRGYVGTGIQAVD